MIANQVSTLIDNNLSSSHLLYFIFEMSVPTIFLNKYFHFIFSFDKSRMHWCIEIIVIMISFMQRTLHCTLVMRMPSSSGSQNNRGTVAIQDTHQKRQFIYFIHNLLAHFAYNSGFCILNINKCRCQNASRISYTALKHKINFISLVWNLRLKSLYFIQTRRDRSFQVGTYLQNRLKYNKFHEKILFRNRVFAYFVNNHCTNVLSSVCLHFVQTYNQVL